MAADFTRTRPNETRKPDFEELPDGRKRLTRYFDLADGDRISDALVEAYGTADAGTASGNTAGFASLRLVKQELRKFEPGSKSVYVKTYEELPATAEQIVGNPTTLKLDDGRTGYEITSLQLVAGTLVPGTVGSSTAPADASAFLQQVEAKDDGTVRTITRRYVYAGTLSQTDSSNQGGKLLIRTIVSAKTEPSTPSGYTWVTKKVDQVNGLPVYTYTFAQGSGRVTTRTDTRYNGKAQLVTITYLGTDDGATPSGTLTSTSVDQRDGYTVTTKTYYTALDDGYLVNDALDYRDNNRLVLHRSTRLGSAPATPAAAIGGTVTLISSSTRQEDGIAIYESTWAEGTGEISRQIDYQESSDQGTTGVTRTTIRYFVAPAATVQPTSLAGSVEVGRNVEEGDGYRIWVTTWAKGTGEIARDTETRYTGKLTRITIRHLTATSVSSQPTSDPISGGTIVSEDRTDQNGYRLWTVVWAKATATGHIVDNLELRNKGKLAIYTRSRFGAVPDTPSATLGGTVVLVTDTTELSDGFTIYRRTWAEGYGVVAEQKVARNDGLLEWHQTIFSADTLPITAATFDTTWKPTANAVLLNLASHYAEGYAVTEASWMVAADGTSAPTSATVTLPRTVNFTVPGLATAANPPTFSPPITRRLAATVYITYSTTANTDTPYSITTWAQLSESYTRLDDGRQYNEVRALDGYVGSSSYSASNVNYRGIDVTSVASAVSGSSPTSRPSGLTVLDAEAEVAFVKYDGTKYYRNTSIKFTF